MKVFSYAVKCLELEMLTVEVVWRSHGVHPYKEGINFMSASKPAVQAIFLRAAAGMWGGSSQLVGQPRGALRACMANKDRVR
jgi:hypothetical protein